MEKLYFLVMKSDLWKEDGYNFLNHYFCEEEAFTTCLLIVLGVAVVTAAVFYGWIANTSYRLTNLTTWLVTMVVGALLTFGITQYRVIGNEDSNSGVFYSIANSFEMKSKTDPNQTPEQHEYERKRLESSRDKIKEEIKSFDSMVVSLHVTQLVLFLVSFFMISLCVKNMTIHGKSVPF